MNRRLDGEKNKDLRMNLLSVAAQSLAQNCSDNVVKSILSAHKEFKRMHPNYAKQVVKYARKIFITDKSGRVLGTKIDFFHKLIELAKRNKLPRSAREAIEALEWAVHNKQFMSSMVPGQPFKRLI